MTRGVFKTDITKCCACHVKPCSNITNYCTSGVCHEKRSIFVAQLRNRQADTHVTLHHLTCHIPHIKYSQIAFDIIYITHHSHRTSFFTCHITNITPHSNRVAHFTTHFTHITYHLTSHISHHASMTPSTLHQVHHITHITSRKSHHISDSFEGHRSKNRATAT